MVYQSVGTGRVAGSHPDLLHAKTGVKSLQMGFALHTGANDQQRSVAARCQLLCRQQRHRCRAPRCHGGSVKQRDALTGLDVKHHDVTLDGGQAALGIAGDEADELGDRHAGVGCRHHKQTATAVQGLHNARRHVHASVLQQGFDFLGVEIIGSSARVAVSGGRFVTLAQVAGRVARAAQPALPPEVERLTVEWHRVGVPIARLRRTPAGTTVVDGPLGTYEMFEWMDGERWSQRVAEAAAMGAVWFSRIAA